MAVFKQTFSVETAITTTGLATLANAATHTSAAVDNSSLLYDEIILEVKLTGTAGQNAWLDMRIVGSIDGGTDWSSWNTPYVTLVAIDFAAQPIVAHFRFVPPPHWKFMIKNNTGAALTAGSASFVGVTYTGV